MSLNNHNNYESVSKEQLIHAKKEKRSKWGSICVTLALAINTLLLVGVLVAIIGVRGRVDETLTKVDAIVEAVEHGKPSEGMLQFTDKLFSSAAGYFFMGNWDGTVAGFVQNLLRYDFKGFAQQFVTFSQTMSPPFAGSQDSLDQGIVTAMNAIRSVATQVAAFQNVNANASDSAALSDGLFRLDHALDFIRAQADAGAWKDAAVVCQAFSTQIGSLSWSGSYIDGNGNQRTWDVTSTVQKITDNMNKVCNKLVQVNP